MTWEIVAIVITVAAHAVGAVVLVLISIDGTDLDWRHRRSRRSGGEDDDGGGGPGVPIDEPPAGPAGGIGPPLPDAASSPRRLREPSPLPPRPVVPRRREREPLPERERPETPVGS